MTHGFNYFIVKSLNRSNLESHNGTKRVEKSWEVRYLFGFIARLLFNNGKLENFKNTDRRSDEFELRNRINCKNPYLALLDPLKTVLNDLGDLGQVPITEPNLAHSIKISG